MSRAWRDPDDVQQDILDEQKKTNRLLEQLLNKLDHFADGGKKVVYGLDEGDPKGDDSVIVARKSGEEPLVFPYNENGPVAKCPKCGEICHIDTTGKFAYCIWHKRFPLEEK